MDKEDEELVKIIGSLIERIAYLEMRAAWAEASMVKGHKNPERELEKARDAIQDFLQSQHLVGTQIGDKSKEEIAKSMYAIGENHFQNATMVLKGLLRIEKQKS